MSTGPCLSSLMHTHLRSQSHLGKYNILSSKLGKIGKETHVNVGVCRGDRCEFVGNILFYNTFTSSL